jgi:hypothetical protein
MLASSMCTICPVTRNNSGYENDLKYQFEVEVVPKYFVVKDGRCYEFNTNYSEPSLVHFARNVAKSDLEYIPIPKPKDMLDKLLYILKLNADQLAKMMDYPALKDVSSPAKITLVLLLILSPLLFVALWLWLLSEGPKHRKPFNLRLDPKPNEGRKVTQPAKDEKEEIKSVKGEDT